MATTMVGPLRAVGDYLSERFPLRTIGVAVVLAYVGSYLVYGNAAGDTTVSVGAVAGAITLLLLFLALRLVDDIDDAAHDEELVLQGGDAVAARRRSLGAGLLLVVVAVVVLNLGRPGMVVALGSIVGMVVAAFVLKPAFSGGAPTADPTSGSPWRDACMWVVTEGVAFVMLAYPYFAWSAGEDRTLRASVVVPVVGVFWTSFEVWKISRYLTRPTWRVYGFSWPAARAYLLTMLGVSLLCQVRVCSVADLPLAFLVVAIAVPLAVAGWLVRAAPVDGEATEGHALHHLVGLMFVALVELSVIVAATVARI